MIRDHAVGKTRRSVERETWGTSDRPGGQWSHGYDHHMLALE